MSNRYFRIFTFTFFLLITASFCADAQLARNKHKGYVAYRNNYQRMGSGSMSYTSYEIRSGQLWGWGNNLNNQLGIGNTTNQSSPVRTGTGSTWVMVAGGTQHTLALRSDGTLWAWGGNFYGQLGIGSTTNQTTPVQVGVDNKWVSISCGNGFSLGLKSDGTLWAWGFNGSGQLGIGSTTQQTAPVQVGVANTWTAISAGYAHAAALRSDGTLWSWGYNLYGQLGIGSTVNQTAPAQVGALTTWTNIACGGYHTIGTKVDGTLWSFGLNGTGQLGIGNTTQQNSPVQVGTDNKWTGISAGEQYSAAVKVDGTLWAWGYGSSGQLGNGATGSLNNPAQVGTGTTWVTVACGANTTMGLMASGDLWIFGDNIYGQLGTGSAVTNQTTPVLSTTLDNNWIQMSTGYDHTLALRSDGTIWAWGANSSGQLGINSTTGQISPVQVGTATNWIAVSAGDDFSLAIKSDGTLWSWGWNAYGQLGNSSATPLVPVQVGTAANWKCVSAGLYHAVGVRNDGTMWGWGYNLTGQVGNGTSTNQAAPVQLGVSTLWTMASAGTDHSMAMRANGTLWGFGWNGFGEMGTGTGSTSPIQVGILTTWTGVSAGGGHSLAMRADGTAYSSGWNNMGQLGVGSTTNGAAFQLIGTNIIDISAKYQHSHMVNNAGVLTAFGLNTSGQLGDGSTTNRTSPVTIASATNVIDLAGDQGPSVFNGIIKAQRLEFCMTGSNISGQLGDGTTTAKTTYNCVTLLQGPANVNTGIQLWYDGSNVNNTTPATNPANNTAVTTWKDISGNANDATVLAGQNTPVINSGQINGHDVIKFNRTGAVLGSVYNVANVDLRSSSMPQTTIFTLYRQGTNTATDYHGVWGNDNGAYDRFFFSRYGANTGIVSIGAPGNFVSVTNSGAVNVPKLVTVAYDNGVTNGSNVYFNGPTAATMTDNTNATAAQTTMRIGWDGDDNPLNGDIAEMVVYNRLLTDCERKAINRYFSYKYGLKITTATITPDTTAYFCTGGSVLLTASTGTSYKWIRNGIGVAGTAQTFSATLPGDYQTVVTANGCPDTSAITKVKEVYTRIYVNGAVAASGTGASWGAAMKTVSEALDLANNVNCATEIWVRSGTYYPMLNDYTTVTTNRDSSFRILRNNIKLYGGFAGTEVSAGQRNIAANPTILSGDISVANDSTDNVYHVITIVPASGVTIDTTLTRVDGFTITRGNGYAATGSFTVNSQTFNHIDGGGIYIAADGATYSNSPSIVNCTFTRNSADYGGSIYMQGFNSGTTKPVVDSCTFTNNHAQYYGGGIMVFNGGLTPVSQPIIRNSSFTSNIAESRGGAVTAMSQTAGAANGLITITDCSFTSNAQNLTSNFDFGGAVSINAAFNTIVKRSSFTSNQSNYGSGISLFNAQALTVDTCTFFDNKASGGSGAIDFYGMTNAVITGSTFTGNKAQYGGAVNVENTATSLTFNDCIFSTDTATVTGGAIRMAVTGPVCFANYCKFLNNYSANTGGALRVENSQINSKYSIFYGNKAVNSGGAISNNSGQSGITNCVFANNITTATAGTTGGGAIYEAAGIVAIGGSTFSENTTASATLPNSNTIGNAGAGLLYFDNDIVWGTAANQIAGTITAANYSNLKGIAAAGTNIQQNPKFVNPLDPDGPDNTWGTTDDGVKLMDCSPSINAGSNALVLPAITTDITGGARILQTIVDQGAYEVLYVTPPAQTAAISITTGAQTICAGTSVTFTATGTNNGGTPVYQWQVNGVNAGTNSNTFTSATLANNDIVTVQITSSLTCVLPATATSNSIQMTVNPSVTPTVSIAITTGTQTICAGASVTFTATPVNGGTTPSYQWQVNGINAGTNSNTFTSTTLTNGAIVTVIMTGNAACPSPATATSTGITMTVNQAVAPSVSIAITAGSQSTCTGSSVTFTATPTNGGTTPSYQWQVNGINAGINSNTFTSTALANNDIVTVIMTSNSPCASPLTATSNSIQMTIGAAVAPSVAIAITAGSQSTCSGSSVTFTATPTNGGTTPSYQWQVNGINAGTNSSTFTSTTLANNDIVTVIMTSNSSCASPLTATSNSIQMTIGAALAPSVAIAITAGSQSTCSGSSVTFTATPTNGGTTPAYQWQVNGINAGTNSNTFTSTTLTNGAIVTVIMTSNSTCASPLTATSNSITMTIGAAVAPSVAIAITAGSQSTCSGSSVTFSATPTNGGTTPSYQWQVNSINAGTNSNTFTSTTLSNNDIVTVIMTSNSSCASPLTATSNSINMTVNTAVTPAVSIVITAGSQVTCAGSSVTFTATPTNGGPAPAYQWKVNGINAGTNSPVFTSSALADNDIIEVVMTSNAPCVSPAIAASTGITMTINSTAPAAVSITATQTTICTASNVVFTATATNGGTTPSYQWQVNGINAGTNSNTFSSSTLSNNDIVKVILTGNSTCASVTTATSNSIQITVSSSITPSVSIAITTGSQTICAGSSVTFTATPVNGGTAPDYQWQVNGVNAGTNSSTFTSTALANNDAVTVILTSNAGCLSTNNVTSNSITMTVNPMLTPSVSIAVTAGSQSTCTGSSVTFTATPVNGGTTVSYQWQVNGINAGTNSNTFTSTALANNDIVTVIMTGSETCVTANNLVSNSITMTVGAIVTPSVTITASQTTTCAGNTVTFTATPTNGGTTPSYQWQVNNVNAGTNSNTFSTSTLADNDIVTVILTNGDPCATVATATSNSIQVTVTTVITPAVSIAITTGAQVTCSGTSITFTATPANGGTAPDYQWQVNGINAGVNSNIFTTASLANNDIVTVIMTGNAGCASPASAASNSIQMTVNATLTPTISIAASQTSICTGGTVLFTATITGGGTAPSYQWQVNGINAGPNSASFATNILVNGDIVTCILTSNLPCATVPVITSNAITITVNTIISPSVSITASATNICVGGTVTFTASATNQGPTPNYQWRVNGINVGPNNPTFTTNTLVNGDQVRVRLSSSAICAMPVNTSSNIITITTNPLLTPSVTIATASTTVCAGSSVLFNATPVNGGSAPSYQWKVNGVNTGTNSSSFATTTLVNGDVVTVVLTSNAGCVSINNVTSNALTMTVNPLLTPTASIAVTTGSQTICAGTSVTFTATITNGGTVPAYQWQVNGINAGTNSNTFTTTTLANNDVVKVILTSNEGCLAVNNVSSNNITMTVNPNLTPSAVIVASSTNVCAGASVTFTATPTNGGTAPSYQWQVNSISAGTNSATFTTTTLANGDVVNVILTSNAGCLATNNISSNSIPMTVNPNLTPSVTITTSTPAICAGSSATFIAAPTNGGSAPAYQWKVNGVNAGTNSATFIATGLVNGDIVTAVLTGNTTCLATNNVTSNAITMVVNPLLTPSVTIAVTGGSSTICSGTAVTFTSTPVNGGPAPSYQWQVNGINAGSNSPTFTNSFLQNNDVIKVILTSNETCLASNNPISNSITMTVTTSVTPSVTISTPQTNVCSGAMTVFTASPVNQGNSPVYQWKLNNSNAGTNSPAFSYSAFLTNDIVSLVMTSSLGCVTTNNVVSNPIKITIATNPVVTVATANDEILTGGTTQLSSTVSETVTSYAWTPSFSLNNPAVPDPIAAPDQNTTYKLTVTSVYGCKGSASVAVRVGSGPKIANTFTPNNDGIHDFWEIKNLETYPDCRVQVFTRMGQMVFESRGYKHPWDGSYKGKPLPFDTYYYIIELNNRTKSKPITGYVTIFK